MRRITNFVGYNQNSTPSFSNFRFSSENNFELQSKILPKNPNNNNKININDNALSPRKSTSPISPLRRSLTRPSLISFRIENLPKQKSSEGEIRELVKKSISDLNRKDNFITRLEGAPKEEVLKNLASGKFSISQLIDVNY